MNPMQRDEMEIYCPKCGWRPTAEDRWSCEPSCGTVWNTFWTRGLCPGCGKQWPDTQCLSCKQFSPHRRWYHTPSAAKSEKRRKRALDTVG